MSVAGVLLPLLLVALCASPPFCHGAAASHNITDILAAFPEFTAFSAALSSTGAAAEIDRRNTITVLAVDDAAMAAARGLDSEDLKRAVFLHVLLDYFDDDKLRKLPAGFMPSTSLFQTTGKARGSDDIVNITNQQDGRVAFMAGAAPGAATFFEKSVHKSSYDIAVLQVSALISSPAAAPAPAPRSSSRQGHAAPAPAPATPATVPVAAPATAPATTPASAPVAAPATAPATTTPSPAPVTAPETAPIPRRRPAPEPEGATAPSPDADDNPRADQKNGGGRATASWTLGVAAMAAVLPAAIVLVL